MLRPLPARLAAGLPGNAVAFALFPIKQSASGAVGGINSSALVTRLFGRHSAKQPDAEIACRRKLDAKAQPAFLAKTRCDLFADELQRAHDLFIAEETPAIELREDAIEAELTGQILEAHRHRCWSSDNHFIAQRIFIADRL